MWALREYLMKESASETQAWGEDQDGRYKSMVSVTEGESLLETRHYFYPDGRVRRILKLEDGILLRDEVWANDGTRQRITSYDDVGEWLWEKTFDRATTVAKLLINRDAFVFFSAPKDLINSLEVGEFQAEWLLDIRWESLREAILEIIGVTKAVPRLPIEIMDQIGLNRLLRMEWRDRWGAPRMEDWFFLELQCTTTGKVSYLRVPPGFSDIMSAIAWTFGMNKESYKLEKQT